MVSDIEKRKVEHIEFCVNKDVSFNKKSTLLEDVELDYKCLPEINLSDVDLSTSFLGKKFSIPLMASAITGGAKISEKINKEIAKSCENQGVGFGLGSMRALLENPSLKETYYVRKEAPTIFVAGNIGVAQLAQYSTTQVEEMLNLVEADALAIHLNAAQEAVQPEGDTDFSECFEKIEEFISDVSLPVYVKEVGHGISYSIAKKLKEVGVKAIDIQGAGGTSWTKVDALRNKNSFGLNFSDFGVPTAASLLEVKKAVGDLIPIIGSGGVRNGLDAAKIISLGADLTGMAMPFLKSQQKNSIKIEELITKFNKELRIASFLTGSKSIKELKKSKHYLGRKLLEHKNQIDN